MHHIDNNKNVPQIFPKRKLNHHIIMIVVSLKTGLIMLKIQLSQH